MHSEFSERLQSFAREAVQLVEQCGNEQATKQYLIIPFIRLLGYDDSNPGDVIPEHEADFSEKYKNRVDYALLSDNTPCIAVECKTVGTRIRDDHGQLRSYFNAMLPVKVGVLSNGLEYEFYVDSVEPNIMDQDPFFSINLAEVATGVVSKNALNNLSGLSKDKFDTDRIMARARRQLLHDGLVDDFIQELKSPSEDLCRYFLKKFDVNYLSKKQIDEIYRAIVKGAFEAALADHILKRLKLEWPTDNGASSETHTEDDVADIDTTNRELAVYYYSRRRLSYLVDSDHLFDEIDKIHYKDFMSKFVVYYDKPWKGKLFEFIEGDDGYDIFIFPDSNDEIRTNNFFEIDNLLLNAFKARVAEFGPTPLDVLSA